MRKFMTVLALSVVIWCGSATALGLTPPPQVKIAKPNIHTAELSNGMRVVMLEDHRLPLVAINVWYHVGSKDEREGRTGFAHLFEHLMFKGTKNLPSESLDRLTEDVGGMNNAFTNDDVTVYLEVVPSNHLRRLLWAEADRLGALSITESGFKSERDVVKEERRQGVENAPYGRIYDELYAAVYKTHPYQHTTIGSMKDLNSATLDDVREFHGVYYVPNNAVLVLVGDFKAAETLPIIKEYFEPLKRGGHQIPRVTAVEPPQTEERRFVFNDATAPLPGVMIAHHIPAEGSPDSYALKVLGNILSNGQSSRLYRELIYNQQIAQNVNAGGNFTEHPNLFLAFAVMSPGKTVQEGERALLAELDKLASSPVTDSELRKAKNQVLSGAIFGQQSLLARAQALGEGATFFNDPLHGFTDLDRIQAVTAADIQRVASTYFKPRNRTVMHVAPAAPQSSGTEGEQK